MAMAVALHLTLALALQLSLTTSVSLSVTLCRCVDPKKVKNAFDCGQANKFCASCAKVELKRVSLGCSRKLHLSLTEWKGIQGFLLPWGSLLRSFLFAQIQSRSFWIPLYYTNIMWLTHTYTYLLLSTVIYQYVNISFLQFFSQLSRHFCVDQKPFQIDPHTKVACTTHTHT